MRITAYEESGKFIGHRVLPVIGLCPGYRHVNLRNECGQTLPLSTLFLCIVVKDYVPDGLSDFAEALANPIKYQNEQEKRAVQLAVLTDDTDLIPDDDSICESSSAAAAVTGTPGTAARQSKIDSLPRGQQSFSDAAGQSLAGGASSSGGGGGCLENGAESGVGQDSMSGTSQNIISVSNSSATGAASSSLAAASQASVSVSVVVSGDGASGAASASTKSIEAIEADAMKAEPLECILAHKLVREKRQEMEKKLESLRKKHDKEKLRICSSPKSGSGGDSSTESSKKSKFNMGNKLVKRLSSKSM